MNRVLRKPGILGLNSLARNQLIPVLSPSPSNPLGGFVGAPPLTSFSNTICKSRVLGVSPLPSYFTLSKFITTNNNEVKGEDEKKEAELDNFEILCNFMKGALGDRVGKVVVSKKSFESPCILVYEGLGSPAEGTRTLEINPESVVIKALQARLEIDATDQVAKVLVLMLFESALLESSKKSNGGQEMPELGEEVRKAKDQNDTNEKDERKKFWESMWEHVKVFLEGVYKTATLSLTVYYGEKYISYQVADNEQKRKVAEWQVIDRYKSAYMIVPYEDGYVLKYVPSFHGVDERLSIPTHMMNQVEVDFCKVFDTPEYPVYLRKEIKDKEVIERIEKGRREREMAQGSTEDSTPAKAEVNDTQK